MQLHVEARAVDVAGPTPPTKTTVVQRHRRRLVIARCMTMRRAADCGRLRTISGSLAAGHFGAHRRPRTVCDSGRRGDLAIVITRDGYTSVERTAAAAQGAREMIDARLTPRATTGQAIAPVLGGTLTSGDATVTIPAGAIGAATTFTLTALGQQGLRGLLPAGWSPVAIADLAPQGVESPRRRRFTFNRVSRTERCSRWRRGTPGAARGARSRSRRRRRRTRRSTRRSIAPASSPGSSRTSFRRPPRSRRPASSSQASRRLTCPKGPPWRSRRSRK